MANSPPRKTVLITGASTGIGAALAREFARGRHNVILVARASGPMEALAGEVTMSDGIEATVISRDLSEPDASRRLVDELRQRQLEVDILVNNAGFGACGPFWEVGEFEQVAMLQVNVASLTHLTRLLLPEMVKRGNGRILNVASTAAYQPGPMMAVYFASKAYVLSFSEALSAELEGTGVTATCLCPGPTRTNFHIRAAMTNSQAFLRLAMSAEAVARAGYEATLAGKRVAIPGMMNKVLSLGSKLTSRRLTAGAVKRFNQTR